MFADKMNHLEAISDKELSAGFRQAGDNFVTFIKENSRPKRIKGSPLNGRSFGSLAKTYIKAVLEKIICIESTYQYVITQENNKAVEDAAKEMKLRMDFLSETFPVAVQTFTDEAMEAQTSAMAVFLKAAVNVEKHPEFQKNLEIMFKEIIEKFQNKNEDASTEKCKQVEILGHYKTKV